MGYTAIIEKTTDGWYMAHCAQIPGANTQGKTIEEAKSNLKEAISLILECEKELAVEQVKNKNVLYRKIGVL
jgi:predicted RNase H-like HicB family nuclease